MQFIVYLCAILLVGRVCCASPSLHTFKSDLSTQSKWEDLFLIDPFLDEAEFGLDEVWEDSQAWTNCGKQHIHIFNPIVSTAVTVKKGQVRTGGTRYILLCYYKLLTQI